jgi:hypothetical protein
MNKSDYKKARRLLRDNGRYALRWFDAPVREEFDHLLFNIQDSTDYLAERADVVKYCKREKLAYNFRNLALFKQNGRKRCGK